jgi:hypothetical protein
MESEPSKAEPPNRKRRWFQFSLRTLLIGVTLVAVPLGYFGWQVKIVRERNLDDLERCRDALVVVGHWDKQRSRSNTPSWGAVSTVTCPSTFLSCDQRRRTRLNSAGGARKRRARR